VSGPQGQVGPAAHQFSDAGRYEILSLGIQASAQISADSSSLGAFSSPSKTVTAIFFGSRLNQSLLVKNSKL
jgi:hypothetical protein